MKIKAEVQVEYKEEKKARIAFKSLEVDNEGFLQSSVKDNIIDFTIISSSLGTFLSTIDDLIFSEITIEKILESNLDNNLAKGIVKVDEPIDIEKILESNLDNNSY